MGAKSNSGDPIASETWTRDISHAVRDLAAARAEHDRARAALAAARIAYDDSSSACKQIEGRLLSLIRPRKAKGAETRPHRREKNGFGTRALKLLALDGGSYSTAALAEEFGGTMGSAYQACRKLAQQGFLTRAPDGNWTLTDKGRESAQGLE